MKTVCYICQIKMESAFNDCPQCSANLTDTNSEKVILSTAGVKFKSEDEPGTDIVLTLTDKRLIMIDAEKEEKKGGFLSQVGPHGGLIGGAIAGALEGAKNAVDGKPLKIRAIDSIPLGEIASLSVEERKFLMIKNKLFKITTRDNKTLIINPGKKTAQELEEEIRKRIG